MDIAIIIPARYGSTRFPGKPLALIDGQTMLSRVVDVARAAVDGSDAVSVYVTTEDGRIADHAAEINVSCILTSESCKTGSDRVLEAAKKLDKTPDFVVNLQGDAPFTPPEIIRGIIQAAQDNPAWDVITPVHRLRWADLDALRLAKQTTPFSGTTAIINTEGRAIWFSKNIIPAVRKENRDTEYSPVYQHVGLYGYRMPVLEKFCTLPESTYEKLEGLEQLRFLEHNIPIHTVIVDPENTLQSGIDSPEDIERANKLSSRY